MEQRLRDLSNLTFGWDGEDAMPIDPYIIHIAWIALSTFLSENPKISEPELGAVEDGRMDISWHTNGLDVFCTLDRDELRIFGSNVMDIRLGNNEEEQIKTLIEIFSCSFSSIQGWRPRRGRKSDLET